jgi:rubrerythrin
MAHVKYRYFARVAREEGHEDIAQHFEHTADQEIKHAWGHLELLIGEVNTEQCLNKAIAGETYEYTEMYPQFEAIAQAEGDLKSVSEFRDQEAEKRFAALARVEQRHAAAYKQQLEVLLYD